uniref:Uncharacterized protein n=1 Tax=Pygocentrus nattereri TaxID=42514 RepID=A0AAR2M606_PYGNA
MINVISWCVRITLTCRPRSRGRASAGRKRPWASPDPSAASGCRARSCPAGTRSRPRCSAGPPWGRQICSQWW